MSSEPLNAVGLMVRVLVEGGAFVIGAAFVSALCEMSSAPKLAIVDPKLVGPFFALVAGFVCFGLSRPMWIWVLGVSLAFAARRWAIRDTTLSQSCSPTNMDISPNWRARFVDAATTNLRVMTIGSLVIAGWVVVSPRFAGLHISPAFAVLGASLVAIVSAPGPYGGVFGAIAFAPFGAGASVAFAITAAAFDWRLFRSWATIAGKRLAIQSALCVLSIVIASSLWVEVLS